MTFPETTTPSTGPETASQFSEDDPFGLGDIPDFLRRTPQPAKPADSGEVMCSTPDQGESQ